MVFWGPPGTGQDHARAADRPVHRSRVRLVLRGHRGRASRARDRARGRGPPGDGTRNDPVRRRDPPLQQGAAGRVPSARGGGNDHADRRDDGEPELRDQRRAAVAGARVRAAAALARGRRRAWFGARSETPSAGSARWDSRSTTTRWPAGERNRMATRAVRSRCSRRRRTTWARAVMSPLQVARDAAQLRFSRYDKGGEETYNILSAFHKSLRGSDPQAALYWMARMLEGGQDPMVIFRRAIAMAAEDIGLADPEALKLAVAARDAFHMLGAPEGYLPLSQMVIYLATAPKSNSSKVALDAALARGAGASGGAGAAARPQRAHEAHEGTGLSRGVSVRACRSGGIHPAGVPPGGVGWIGFLRARTVRIREGDREAARLVGGASRARAGRPCPRGRPANRSTEE